MRVALVECGRCHQVAEMTAPDQRHCGACRAEPKLVAEQAGDGTAANASRVTIQRLCAAQE